MLNEIVLAETFMGAVMHTADPPFELAMPLVLVANPIGFSFKGLWVRTIGESAGERLHVLMYML